MNFQPVIYFGYNPNIQNKRRTCFLLYYTNVRVVRSIFCSWFDFKTAYKGKGRKNLQTISRNLCRLESNFPITALKLAKKQKSGTFPPRKSVSLPSTCSCNIPSGRGPYNNGSSRKNKREIPSEHILANVFSSKSRQRNNRRKNNRYS